MGQQKRALRHSRGGERGFSTGMAAADNNDVEVVRKPHWGGEFYASVVEAGTRPGRFTWNTPRIMGLLQCSTT